MKSYLEKGKKEELERRKSPALKLEVVKSPKHLAET